MIFLFPIFVEQIPSFIDNVYFYLLLAAAVIGIGTTAFQIMRSVIKLDYRIGNVADALQSQTKVIEKQGDALANQGNAMQRIAEEIKDHMITSGAHHAAEYERDKAMHERIDSLEKDRHTHNSP